MLHTEISYTIKGTDAPVSQWEDYPATNGTDAGSSPVGSTKSAL